MAQYFNLTLDTQAPTGSGLSGLNAYYNGAVTVTVSATGASYMKVWVNKNATGATTDTEFPSSWEAFAGTKQLTPSTEGTNYFHAIVMDEVGNQSAIVDSASFIFDTTAPTISAVENAARVKVKTVDVKVTFSDLKDGVDAVSGVNTLKITGTDTHIAEQTFTLDDTDRTNGYKTCAVALTISAEEEAAKVPVTCSFGVVATDRAGNASSSSAGSVIYDAFPASATMTLMDKTCTTALPSYVNAYDYGIQITSSDTDIESYKVWEGSSEPTNWTAWPGSPLNLTDKTFSTGEGLKTIHAKIKDTTGNETVLTDVSTTVDTTAPVVTLSSDVSIISAETGHNTVTFTLGGTDAHNMPEWELYVDGSKLTNGTFSPATSPVSDTVTVNESDIVAKSAGEGQKSFVLKIKDVAGNWGESSALTVTVDLTAPTGTVTAPDYFKKGDTVQVTLSATDTGGSTVAKMKVWTGSSEPTDWETYATTKTFTLADGSYTVSAKFMDAVGNAMTTAATDSFIVDTVDPVVNSVTLTDVEDGYTKVVDHTATINASDATPSSTIDKMKVWGDITGATTEPETWEDFSTTKAITLTTGDGLKYVHVKVRDKAGNVSTAYDYSVFLDQTPGTASVALFKTDGTTALPAITNVTGFVARIAFADAQEAAGVQYKLTGDFAPQTTTWTTYTEDTGKDYMTISDLNFTTPDGSKSVTVLFKDKAGNESTNTVTHKLDTTLPVVTTTEPNYSVLSTQHTKRLDGTGAEKAGDKEYNDIVTFKFQADEDFIEYKVCVNAKDQTAAGAEAIGTTYGSLNMSGTATKEIPFPNKTDIACTLFGKDFAVAMGEDPTVSGKVIAKEVIIYVQDCGENWSAVHAIS